MNYKEATRDDIFKVDEQYKDASGIYKIQLENEVYIGQTSNFWNRFYSHYRIISKKSPYQSVLVICNLWQVVLVFNCQGIIYC